MHTFETVLETVNDWTLNEYPKPRKSRQRLGQWLMNKLQPLSVDTEIFYTEDDSRAYELFKERYVDEIA